MEKTVTFYINRTTPAKLEEELVICKPLKRLTISVDVEKEEHTLMGYLVVRDEKNRIRIQKILGYGERTIVIARHAKNTTIGGVPGPIGAGTWKIVIYLFAEYIEQTLEGVSLPFRIQISDRKTEIQETIGKCLWVDRHYREQLWLGYYNKSSFYSSRGRWYKGDFHTHTHLSDGKESVSSAMRKARMMDLDFYVPTEHNVIPTGWEDDYMLILPGVEITTKIGHCNLIGIDKMPERLPEIMEYADTPEVEEYLYEILREAKKREWIISINHPFLTIWKWKYGEVGLDDITCLEIINDPTYTDARESNDQAIRYLDFLWEDGHRIWGIGGSDSHNLIEERYKGSDKPSIAGDPGTYVFCPSLTPELLLKHVKQGNIYVSRFCTADVRITSQSKSFFPGDRMEDVERKIMMEIEIFGNELEEGITPVIWIVQNEKRIKLTTEKTKKGYRAVGEVHFLKGKWNWARLEARTADGEFLLYSNPVWQGAKRNRFRTYREALEAFHAN